MRRAVEEMCDDRDFAVVDEIYPASHDGNAAVSALLKGVPDLRITIDDQVAEAVRVATRCIAEGHIRASRPPSRRRESR